MWGMGPGGVVLIWWRAIIPSQRYHFLHTGISQMWQKRNTVRHFLEEISTNIIQQISRETSGILKTWLAVCLTNINLWSGGQLSQFLRCFLINQAQQNVICGDGFIFNINFISTFKHHLVLSGYLSWTFLHSWNANYIWSWTIESIFICNNIIHRPVVVDTIDRIYVCAHFFVSFLIPLSPFFQITKVTKTMKIKIAKDTTANIILFW